MISLFCCFGFAHLSFPSPPRLLALALDPPLVISPLSGTITACVRQSRRPSRSCVCGIFVIPGTAPRPAGCHRPTRLLYVMAAALGPACPSDSYRDNRTRVRYPLIVTRPSQGKNGDIAWFRIEALRPAPMMSMTITWISYASASPPKYIPL